jgi:hypothetical protein
MTGKNERERALIAREELAGKEPVTQEEFRSWRDGVEREVKALTQGMSATERLGTKILQGESALAEQKSALRNVNIALQSELDAMRANDGAKMRELEERVSELASRQKEDDDGLLHALAVEMVGLAERIEALEATAQSLSFTPEDVDLIKQHVRHPGALEAAKLRARIQAALVALDQNVPALARRILEAP